MISFRSLSTALLVATVIAGCADAGAATAATPAPEVLSSGISSIGATTATLRGTVNPHGSVLAGCYFEYGTSESYGSSVPCVQSVDGPELVVVSAEAQHLQPATQYYFKLVVSSGEGGEEATGEGEALSSHTSPLPVPTVFTDSAIAGETTATLQGSIFSSGSTVTACSFEYGTTIGYGASVACAQNVGELSGSAESSSVAVSAPIAGLQAGTVYHYRLVVSSAGGVVYGDDLVLQTTDPVISPGQQSSSSIFTTIQSTPVYQSPSTEPSGYSNPKPRVSPAMARCDKLTGKRRAACVARLNYWPRVDAGLSVYLCPAESRADSVPAHVSANTASATRASSIGAGATLAITDAAIPASPILTGAVHTSAARAHTANTSEAGWPPDECLKMDKGPAGEHHTIIGVPDVHNWLLGGYGDDTIIGGNRGDVIWGDYRPTGEPRQTAIIHAGNGRNVIYANDTRDYVWTGTNPRTVVHAHDEGTFGVIHCQSPGIVVFLSTTSERHFRLDGCKHVSHYSVGY